MLDGFVLPLAAQAIPRLCNRLGVECSLQEEIFPAGAKERDVDILNRERERILGELISKHGVSTWDLFDESGIGQERNALAKDFVRSDSSVLDVATGRGYFAFASARRGGSITAVDIMDGAQRSGWWRVFLRSSRRLGLSHATSAIGSDGSNLPLVSESFKVVSCIHAIRNFLVPNDLKRTVDEMHRTTARGGEVVVAESSMESESPAEEVYLAYLRLRTRIGWETIPPDGAETVKLLEDAGYSKTTSTTRRFSRDYAPVEFPSFFISEQPPTIREEHDRIEKLRSRHGIKPTPVTIVSGKAEA